MAFLKGGPLGGPLFGFPAHLRFPLPSKTNGREHSPAGLHKPCEKSALFPCDSVHALPISQFGHVSVHTELMALFSLTFVHFILVLIMRELHAFHKLLSNKPNKKWTSTCLNSKALIHSDNLLRIRNSACFICTNAFIIFIRMIKALIHVLGKFIRIMVVCLKPVSP